LLAQPVVIVLDEAEARVLLGDALGHACWRAHSHDLAAARRKGVGSLREGAQLLAAREASVLQDKANHSAPAAHT